MNQGTILGSQIGRWIILAALVALLGALLLTIRPVGAQDAPPSVANAQTVFYYDERGTGPVTTYSATDPEGRPIFWTLGGADAASFTIEDGALRFRSSPDFEGPTDQANDENGNGTVENVAPGTGNEGLANNVYKVTVRFSAGGEDGDPDPTDDYDGDDLDDLDLTINVTNVNEPGAVAISSLQPQIGTQLVATLTDSDVQVGFGQWQWAGGPAKSGLFTPITSWVDRNLDPNAHTYRPVDDDLGKYLQVSVRYKDKVDDTVKTAQTVSDYAVRKDIVTSNANPKFPDQRTLVGGTDINRGATWRYVPENSPAGTPVGARVTAFDDETSIDVITYSLSDGPTNASLGHARSFNIDPATGQITVAAGTRLNRADDSPGGTTTYSVTVTGTDGDGHSEDITVTITVVKVNEPPRIDRVYRAAVQHTDYDDYVAGDRAPTEMSHYESDRTLRSDTRIDTDLDSSVLIGTDGNPVTTTENLGNVQPATYTASDPENDDITWSLEGHDKSQFTIRPKTGPMATLAFGDGPDFEEGGREDRNKDNVYEVTIVATDSTLVNHDKLDVTVKVIDSTEDNQPGKVYLSNRQPEGASLLTASLDDPDKPITGPTWQWYRSEGGTAVSPATCGTVTGGVFTPAAALINDDGAPVAAAWEIIVGAALATYTPKWDADGDPEDDAGRCLRATAMYTDWVAADPTMPDDPETADVDESKLPEMAHGVSHNPVQVEDTENKRPVFRVDPDIPASAPADSYVISVPENMGPIDIGILRDAGTDGVLDEVLAAIDDETGDTDTPADGIDNPNDARNTDTDDTLTYTLGGTDAASFRISGSIQLPVSDEENAGQLMTKGSLNFEPKREYRLTVTATDPTGDSATISVIVNVTDENDPLQMSGPVAKDYTENDTDAIGLYTAMHEDLPGTVHGGGITYTLVSIGDYDVFTVSSLDGSLTFKPRPDGKARPNYELPEDMLITDTGFESAAVDNLYIVAVRAAVAGTEDPTTEAESFTEIADLTTADRQHRIVRVRVLNENEPPVFALDEDTQGIKENPDDLLQDPRLNRGVGGNPAVGSLDVGIPVIAVDDDNEVDANDNFPDFNDAPAEINEGHMVDGLTYTLSGADAEAFDIVPATGQILTVEKLDYETKDEYNVTVTATDTGHPSTGADRLSNSINVTIEVIDVEEVPVPSTLTITGDGSPTHAENTADLGEYTVTAFGDAKVGTWIREGADAEYFMLTGSGASRMLKFSSAPDYENPRGAAKSDTNTNTYEVTLKVTDSSNSDIVGTFGVTITVTGVDELGALGGSDTASINEGDTDLGTYTLTGGDGTSTVTWSVDGTDMSQFMLDGTGMSRMLKFSSAPDYETPMGGAANDSNTYMVTVMASAGGEMAMQEVTVMVDNVEERGTVTLNPTRPSVGTAITATLEDDDIVSSESWQWASADAMDGTFTNISGATSATYTPVAADAGMYLRAMATYTDGFDSGNVEMAVSASAVTQVAVNVAPVFANAATTRSIAENTAARANIGAPVEATDPNGDTLTYTLGGTNAASFGIVGSTGQLRTSAALDFETKSTYSVEVTATDLGGLSDTIDVTINVTDVVEVVPEVPAIVQGYDTNNTPGIQISELFDAIDDYFAGQINISELFEVIDAYFG